MEFVLEKRGYVDNCGKLKKHENEEEGDQEVDDDDEEEEEDEEEEGVEDTRKEMDKETRDFLFSSERCLPYDDNSNRKLCLDEQFHDHTEQDLFRSQSYNPTTDHVAAASNFNERMQLVGFTPRRNHESEAVEIEESCRIGWQEPVEQKEHMFDKVVTPSDVGKLNRLVIPKQYAEKFFPLGTSSNEKGLLLNFEDRSGKTWRFRYSYWNSSQSYVMTRGWSRFVKERRLDAGDIVSFHRGVGESGKKDRFYIDWRHRPAQLDRPMRVSELVGWNAAGVFFPPSPIFLSAMPHHQDHNLLFGAQDHRQLQQLTNDSTRSATSYNRQDHQNLYSAMNYNSGPSSTDMIRGSASHHQADGIHMGLDQLDSSFSMAVVQSNTNSATATAAAAPKRLRLFGVNMECTNFPETGN